jgi:hypothetical protein
MMEREMIISGSIISPVFILIAILMMLSSSEVGAMPSFARQTGMSCSACHVQAFGPGLTPTGRNFKLYGYTEVSDDRTKFIPIAGMIRGSLTHTNNGQPGGAADRFGPNNNATIDEASIFYAGRITSKMGAFVQGTFDGVSNTGALDNTDIRFADYADLAGNRLVYGVSVNNNPTVQDLWNTTPAWGFPWASSPLAPTPAAGLFIESLGSQVVGATVYTMWNNLLYVEGGGYTSLPRNAQQGIGTFDAGQNRIDGGAPYWRVALQKDWHGHYGAIGSFGMRANANPQRMQGAGTDQYTDFGFDATYQYLVNPAHIFELNATYIREHRDLNASVALGFAEKKRGSLDVVRVRSGYTFRQTYALSLGYAQTSGTRDSVIYSPDPIGGSLAGKPNSQAFTAEVSYTPFGKSTSVLSTFGNLRLAVQYIHYFQFNGGFRNYDGSFRNAAGNDTVYLNGWLAF